MVNKKWEREGKQRIELLARGTHLHIGFIHENFLDPITQLFHLHFGEADAVSQLEHKFRGECYNKGNLFDPHIELSCAGTWHLSRKRKIPHKKGGVYLHRKRGA